MRRSCQPTIIRSSIACMTRPSSDRHPMRHMWPKIRVPPKELELDVFGSLFLVRVICGLFGMAISKKYSSQRWLCLSHALRYYDFYASYTYQILVGGSYKTGQSVRIAGKEKKDGIGGRLTERHVWEAVSALCNVGCRSVGFGSIGHFITP